ncbi:hypothetical protein AVEN_43822-1 [Araneus ventricosus]|uniref:Uncharacterized protein n=1 Tax=Araneus ventricosus TaxID=182803 RepID=A0A4Y2I009_ARAVE|nr:hypothetical protein AVEN_43822-1 [Araneus ventricosus]
MASHPPDALFSELPAEGEVISTSFAPQLFPASAGAKGLSSLCPLSVASRPMGEEDADSMCEPDFLDARRQTPRIVKRNEAQFRREQEQAEKANCFFRRQRHIFAFLYIKSTRGESIVIGKKNSDFQNFMNIHVLDLLGVRKERFPKFVSSPIYLSVYRPTLCTVHNLHYSYSSNHNCYIHLGL